MGQKKLGQEPAFSQPLTRENGQIIDMGATGMSKRFYAACAAMQGILSNPDWAKSANIADDFDEYKERVVRSSYEFADELLKQENS